MRLVENHEWAAVLLAQPCALLMAALWAAVPVGSHTESLNAAMVWFQYGRRCGGVGCCVVSLESPVRWSVARWLVFVNISQRCSIYCGLDVSRFRPLKREQLPELLLH